MNKAGGFITLHRQILDWEWYKNTNTKVLFLHLLLNANFREASFEGHKISRGQLVTSLSSLSSETGLSVRQVRVSLDHLIMTGEVTSKSYPRYRIITIVRYNDYQDDDKLNDSQMTSDTSTKRQADDRLMTSKRQANDKLMTTIEQGNKDNKETRITMEQDKSVSAKRFTPPTPEDLHTFCQENGITIDEDRFMNYYQSNGWKVGRNSMKDWKATARNWARQDQKKDSGPAASGGVKKVVAQDYEQRDYSEEHEQTADQKMAWIKQMMLEEGI